MPVEIHYRSRMSSGMRCIAGLGAALALFCGCGATALADGKLFSGALTTPPSIPGQQAIVVFDGAHETLVIDTELAGGGADLAWVIPVPSIPEVTPATRGTVATCSHVTSPLPVPAPPRLAAWLLLAFVALPAMLVMVFARLRDLLALLALLTTTAVGAIVFMPALGTAGARGFVGAERGAEPAGDVSILHEGRAGEFDFTVIGGTDGTAIAAWLAERSFVFGPGAVKAFADYAAEGWVFVAGRRRMDSGAPDGVASLDGAAPPPHPPPHPVALRFATDRAVYPMRLTGADDNGALLLRLYVFGGGRAESALLETVACLPVERRLGDVAPVANRPRGRAVIGHGPLLSLIGEATTLTRLEGSLDPADMANDITIAWEAPSIIQPSVAVRMGDPLGLPLPAIMASGAIAFGVAFVVLWRLPRATESTDPGAVATRDAADVERTEADLAESARMRRDPDRPNATASDQSPSDTARPAMSRLGIAAATLMAIGLLCAGWRMWDLRADVGRRDARLASTHTRIAENIREEIETQRAAGVATDTLLADLRAESWLVAPYFNPIIRQRGVEGDGPGEGRLSLISSDAPAHREADSAATSSGETRVIYTWHDATGASFTIPLETDRR